ncbi:hypothetical protein G6514_002831 [Epicoccum nigrum]|nr:hypothetical protein G6514_002831 [Epicoccum nigrum]
MSKNVRDTKTAFVDDAIRIRDNQRRSRARRKDLIKDLQMRVQEYEQKGVAATQDMQRAARKVVQENERLRALLARHGVLRDEVDSFLRVCEQTEAPSSAEPEAMPSLMSRSSSVPNNPYPTPAPLASFENLRADFKAEYTTKSHSEHMWSSDAMRAKEPMRADDNDDDDDATAGRFSQ